MCARWEARGGVVGTTEDLAARNAALLLTRQEGQQGGHEIQVLLHFVFAVGGSVGARGARATRCRVQVECLDRCLGRCCSSLGNKDCCGKPGERGAFHRRMKNDRVTNPPQSLQSLRAVSSSHGSIAALHFAAVTLLLLLLLLLDNPLPAPGQGIISRPCLQPGGAGRGRTP